jgi:cyclic beta-1,2-glucan synthetase
MAMAFAALGDNRRAWELTAMINPINHTRSAESIETYRAEPYAVAADVYAFSPHAGRGGWSWYTGSAGWMYQLILESLLGLKLEVNRLSITPLLPTDWPGFTVHYRYRKTIYHIVIRRQLTGDSAPDMTVDGAPNDDKTITLVDDEIDHEVEVRIPAELP